MKQNNHIIALDVMSGDHGASVVMLAALQALQQMQDIHLLLVGDEAVIAAYTRSWPLAVQSRMEIIHSSQTVGMDETPALALRNKKDSSMRRSIDLVKLGRAHACVSAGNTGALMATARYVLKTLPGIDRPAIATALPSLFGRTYMLDLGANIDVEAEHLYQFAAMGSVLVSAIEKIDSPRVGLLNIG